MAALGYIDDHFGAPKRIGVLACFADLNGSFTMQDAMAAAGIASGDSGDGQRYNSGIEQGDEPADGADEAFGLGDAPVHVLGPIDSEDFLGQLSSQQLGGGAAFALHCCADVLTLGSDHLLKRGDDNASLLGEGFGSRRGCAVFEGHLPRGAGQLLFRIGLTGKDALGQHGQAARRGVSGDLCSLGEEAPAA